MIHQEIKQRLLALRDEKYRNFQSALIPTVLSDTFIGVRTPDLRALAKEFAKREDAPLFLAALPHDTFDENQLHAFLLCEIKNFDSCLAEVERFLPYVDNWATCDQMSPKVFKKNKQALLPIIDRWLASGKTYTVRFAIGMLMQHFLDEDFTPLYLEKVAAVRSEEYYVNMMAAWYFATALAKRYEETIPYFEEKRLSPFVYQKGIRKALESYRIPDGVKEHLRSLK